ncbi:hypothetical protein ACFYOT_25815 [Saccharothrix saharensis]|uniref:hypothetical protein n=1 Tax=Saccharothrix saharensis TaxID=571190 RepID=UPI0036C4096B
MNTSPAGTTPPWRLHCLSGGYREVAMGLFGLPRAVVDGAWYVLLLDTDRGAGVHLFTRVSDAPAQVVTHEWTAPDLGDLPSALLEAAWRTDTTDSPEEVLRARCALITSGPSIAPISSRGAFGRPFDSLRGQRARALVLAR